MSKASGRRGNSPRFQDGPRSPTQIVLQACAFSAEQSATQWKTRKGARTADLPGPRAKEQKIVSAKASVYVDRLDRGYTGKRYTGRKRVLLLS